MRMTIYNIDIFRSRMKRYMTQEFWKVFFGQQYQIEWDEYNYKKELDTLKYNDLIITNHYSQILSYIYIYLTYLNKWFNMIV